VDIHYVKTTTITLETKVQKNTISYEEGCPLELLCTENQSADPVAS
jgi:hypothetical protein